MFDFDTGKLVVVGVVALIVIGPKDLPRVLRTVGATVAKLRRMAADFQGQFMDAMREAELTDVKAEMSKIAESAKIDVAFDPIRDIRNQISGAIAGETTAQALPSDVSALPDSPASGIDLSSLGPPPDESVAVATDAGPGINVPMADADPAAFVSGGESMAVATGMSPGFDAPVATTATLDDVREALDHELGEPDKQTDKHERDDTVRPLDAHAIKEPAA